MTVVRYGLMPSREIPCRAGHLRTGMVQDTNSRTIAPKPPRFKRGFVGTGDEFCDRNAAGVSCRRLRRQHATGRHAPSLCARVAPVRTHLVGESFCLGAEAGR